MVDPEEWDWIDGDYPTEAALARIEHWPSDDVAGCLDFVKNIWHWPDFATYSLSVYEAGVLRAQPDETYLRLATGGWSGNESIVSALRRNRIVHMATWRLSACGGLHIYQYPEVVIDVIRSSARRTLDGPGATTVLKEDR